MGIAVIEAMTIHIENKMDITLLKGSLLPCGKLGR